MSSMKTPDLELKMKFSSDNLRLPSQQAASLALVLNELLQNALEHGFENRKQGNLTARIERLPAGGTAVGSLPEELKKAAAAGTDKNERGTLLLLQVEDDGVGLPQGFDMHKTKSLGLKIVQTIVQSDLKGVFSLRPGAGRKGTVAQALIRI
jgi:two-component sensor histidine kinase